MYTKAYIDASFGDVYTKAYVDTSFGSLVSYNETQDTSINLAIAKNTAQDVSINDMYTKAYIDASFGDVYTKAYVDTSFASLVSYNGIQDTSINDTYTKAYVDASFGDVYVKAYVDNSFASLVSYNGIQDTSINNTYTKTYIDTSFSDIYTSITTTGTITANGGFIGTSYQPSAATTAITFGNNITTGDITIGESQTTGNLNLGTGTSRAATGNVFIGTGATATNTINIGRGNVVSIVNSATPTLTINQPIKTSYTYPVSDVSMIGYQFSVNNTSFSNPWVSATSIGIMTPTPLVLRPGVWNLSGYCHIRLSNNAGITYGLSTVNNAFNTSSGTLPSQTVLINSNIIGQTNYWPINIVYVANANTNIYFLFQPNTTQPSTGFVFTRAGIIATRIA
jgi:hypothetical protein